MRLTLLLLAAIACGGPARPGDVRASVRDGAVEISWTSLPFAAARVQLLDFDTGAPASDAVVVHGTRPRVAGKASGVTVEALPGEKVLAVVGAGAQGGSGST